MNTIISALHSSLFSATPVAAPIRQPSRRSTCVPWFNQVLKYYKSKKNKLFKKYLKRGPAYHSLKHSPDSSSTGKADIPPSAVRSFRSPAVMSLTTLAIYALYQWSAIGD